MLVGPFTVQQGKVNVASVAVGVEIGAWVLRGQQRHAALGGWHVELVDEAVFAVSQVIGTQTTVEIVRHVPS